MKRCTTALVIGAALLALAACGEKPQHGSSSAKVDAQAYQGTGVESFTAPDWKAGDRTSWEQRLSARTKLQNEYPRVQGN